MTPAQLGVVAIAVAVGIWMTLGRWRTDLWSRVEKAKADLGLPNQNTGLFLGVALLWTPLVAILTAGLIWVLLDLVWRVSPEARAQDGSWTFRNVLAQIGALTAVLGAVVALPITLSRVRLTREANETAQDALYNEKINAASNDLFSRRLVTRNSDSKDTAHDIWEDDIPRRNAAIDRLEALVRERPEEAVRVSPLLSVYVRELSKEVPAVEVPSDVSAFRNYEWTERTPPARPDIENAVQALGNLNGEISGVKIHLSAANLQKSGFGIGSFRGAHLAATRMQSASLIGLDFDGANFSKAEMQSAFLFEAKLNSTLLFYTQLQNVVATLAEFRKAKFLSADFRFANLGMADFRGAKLDNVRLEGATLTNAKFQGADFSNTSMDESTGVTGAFFLGAAMRSLDEATMMKLQPFWPEMFADGSVVTPVENARPEHWPVQVLQPEAFRTQWHAWMRSIGMDPANPE